MRLLITMVLLFISYSAFAFEPAIITGLQIQSLTHSTRITFDLSKKTAGRVKSSVNPDRLQIDFVNARKSFQIPKENLLRGNQLKVIEALDLPGPTVRFIFAVKGKVKWTTTYVPSLSESGVALELDINQPSPIIKKPLKLSVDLNRQKKLELDMENAIADAKISSMQKQVTQQIESLTPTIHKSAPIFTIVIDPGHGGKDSGARGDGGAYEKNVVLAISKRLAYEINKHPNWHAVLTRNGDYFISLGERLRLARKYKADLFIAVHADAYFNNRARGVSVYALSEHSASSLAARWLAQRENHAELGDIEFGSLKDQSSMLRSVLIDLALTTTKQDSLRLGTQVLNALDDISMLHSSHVEQAPFMVLKSPDIPSILVETGFISNPVEERNLNNMAYQHKMAAALSRGITQYLQKYNNGKNP